MPTEFSNAQITNTSYIAKYVRNKLQEVCRDVQFTNGAATGELRKNDWRLGDLLDKIRYEEETQIDIDEYLGAFKNYKKDFDGWRKKKNNSTDLTPINWKEITPDITSAYEEETKNPLFEWWNTIQKFDTWRGAKGKKDRSDHRHHLLDAIITACCSRSIIQKLSTLNAAREKNGYAMYDERGFLTREKIECPLIYKQIKDALKDNLIFHKAEQRLLTSKVNKIKRKRNHPEDSIYLKQKTYSVRGSLVGDNFYGKLKNPRHQGFEKDSVFVKRVTLSPDNFKDEKSLDKIVDANVREILKRRLALSIYNGKGEKAFSEESLINDPVFLFSLKAYPIGIPEKALSKNGLPLPVIKKVRVANKNARNLVQLTARDECKNVVNENRYAEADGNFIMALYESKSIDKKGKIKIKRDFEIISFYEAIKRRKKGEKLFSDEKIQKDGTSLNLMINCPSLKQGEMVLIFNESEDEIDWTDVENLKRKLYKVTELGLDYRSENEQYGTIKFARHNKQKTVKDSYSTEGDFIKKLHTGINAIKVKVSNLGKIERVMELTSSHPTLTTLPI